MAIADITTLLVDLASSRQEHPGDEDRIITEVIVASDELCARVARRHARYAGLDWGRDADDLISIVRETALKMLHRIADGDPTAEAFISGWESALFVRGRSAIREYADSAACTGVSGCTATVRRQRSLDQHRQLLQNALHEPVSVADLLESWNDVVVQTRSNPQKQGAFATEADVVPVRVYPEEPRQIPVQSVREHAALDYLDATDLISRTKEVCAATDPFLGEIAALWFSWFPDGEPLRIVEIQERLHTTSHKARSGVEQVRRIFRDMMVDQ